MLITSTNVIYKAFGLHIASEIFLPELLRISEQVENIDVEIKMADLTTIWAEFEKTHGDFGVKENQVLFEIPNLAIFSIQNGNKILFSPMGQSKEGEIRLFLLGTCMGVILQQRRLLPLHGSAIEINGKAYGFIGDSGAGKSTLASAFINKGYRLLTDDIIAVYLSENGIPLMAPSYPQQKLWQESLDNFGIKDHNYLPLFERETKYAVPVHSQFSSEKIPLEGIFELVKNNTEQIEVIPIQGLERFHKLFYHTYRNFMIGPSGLMEWHLNTSACIVNKINFFQLSRPNSQFTAEELTTTVLRTIHQTVFS